MKQVPVRLGPLALLLTVVAICMTVLALLTFSTARADLAMAERFGESTRLRYELEAQGQAFLGEAAEEVMDAAVKEYLLPAGSKIGPGELARYGEPEILKGLKKDGDGCYWKSLEKDGLTLEIGLEWDGVTGELAVVCWQFSTQWQAPEEIGGLWLGE